ncbi:hypothetical protein GCE65_04350 [Pseudactinotalea sp. HY158]|nr:hypothetical protein GCE65_04350 [Pseudactinotalea sp. HY158]
MTELPAPQARRARPLGSVLLSPSATLPPHDLLDLQRLVGNRATAETALPGGPVEHSSAAGTTLPAALTGAATEPATEPGTAAPEVDTDPAQAQLPESAGSVESPGSAGSLESPESAESAGSLEALEPAGSTGSAGTTAPAAADQAPAAAGDTLGTRGGPIGSRASARAPVPASDLREGPPPHPVGTVSSQALTEETMVTAADLDDVLAQEWGTPGSPERQAKVAEAWQQADVLGSAWTGAKSSAAMGAATLVAQKAAAFALLEVGLSQGAKIAGPVGAIVGGYGAVQSLWGKTIGGEGISTHEWAGWDGEYGAWADNLALISDVLALLGDLVGTIGLVAGILAGVGLLAVVPGLQFLAALIPPSLTVLKATTVAGLFIGVLQIAAQAAASACRRQHLLTMELSDEAVLIEQQRLLSQGVTELAGAAGGAVGGAVVDASGRASDRVGRHVHERIANVPVLAGGGNPDRLIVRRQGLSPERLEGIHRVDDAFGRPVRPLTDIGRAADAARTSPDRSVRGYLEAFDEAFGRGERTRTYAAEQAALGRRASTRAASRAKDAAVQVYENRRDRSAASGQRLEAFEHSQELVSQSLADRRESRVAARELTGAREREHAARVRVEAGEAEVVRIDREIDAVSQSMPADAERIATLDDRAAVHRLIELQRTRDDAAGRVTQAHADLDVASQTVKSTLDRHRSLSERADRRAAEALATRDEILPGRHTSTSIIDGSAERSLREAHEQNRQAEASAFQPVSRAFLHYEQERNLLRRLDETTGTAAREEASRWQTFIDLAGPPVSGATGGATAATKARQDETRTEAAPLPDLPPTVTSAHIDQLAVATTGADALARESSADAADAADARARSSASQAQLEGVAAGLDAAAADSERLDGALTHRGEVRTQLEAQHEETAAKVTEPTGRFSVLDSLVSLVQDLLGFGAQLNNPDLPERVQSAGRSLGETGTGIEESWGTTRTAFTDYDAVGGAQERTNAAGRGRLEESRDTVPRTRAGLTESQGRVAGMIADAAAATESADAAHGRSSTTAAAAAALGDATHARHESAVAEYDAWGLAHEAARQEATEARVRDLEEAGYEVTATPAGR